MKILAKAGKEEIATVYIGEFKNGKKIEFVESIQPPLPKSKKWVLIVSSLFGCPVKCRFCDAGGAYQGKLSKDEILSQIDFLIKKSFPDKKVTCEKFKIQFARMGEPALNENILDVLEELPFLYEIPGFIPSISTIAPEGTDKFFQRLLKIKQNIYKDRFQMQFSIHSTDENMRDWLIPVRKWDFKRIKDYGESFYEDGDRKITLNFALSENTIIDPAVLLKYFSPEKFLIKITPVNPTYNAFKNNLSSKIQDGKTSLINKLEQAGYSVILSIGELEENNIGSNCGQYLLNYLSKNENLENSYTYELQTL